MSDRILFVLFLLFSTALFAGTPMSNNPVMPEAPLTPEQIQACMAAAHQSHAELPADCPTPEALQNHGTTCQEAYRNNTPLPPGCPTLQEAQQKAACWVATRHNNVVSGCE